MSRVVFVLLDGLAAATARRCMSFMQSLTDAGLARHTELQGELPPLSRPIYATLLTGLRPAQADGGLVYGNDAQGENRLYAGAAPSGNDGIPPYGAAF